MFDLEGFANTEFAVNCRTKKEMEDFLSFLHSWGFTWSSLESLTSRFIIDNVYRVYEENTCFISDVPGKVVYFNGRGGTFPAIPMIPYGDCVFDVLDTDENVSLLLQLLGA